MGNNKQLRVGIVGGGIAGVGLALDLCRHPHLDVTLFEAAKAFGEIGAGVSFGPNAVRAIHGLGLGTEYRAIADSTPAPWQDIWFEWRRGSDAGYLGASIAPGVGQSSVHRADFLDALASRLPDGIARFGKRALRVEQDQAGARVVFADGSNWHGDVVIGADGIKSNLRGHVLDGLGLAPESPRFTGTCAYRGLIDIQLLREAFSRKGLDAHVIDVPQMYLGLDAHILTFPVKQGRIINVVAFVSDRDTLDPQWSAEKPWAAQVEQQEMLQAFAGWGAEATTILECIASPSYWALHELAELKGYVHGRVGLIGDAAHAMLPHQGAGAGQGLEDAWLLAQLFGDPRSATADPARVLRAYDDIRRPRACRVQRTSREAGELYEFRDPAVGDDDALLGSTLATRFDWLWNHDQAQELVEARQQLGWD